MFANNQLKYDVVIIGAGVSGTACFVSLVKKSIQRNIKTLLIAIVERTDKFGPGLPYRTDQNKTLILNDPNYTASLDKSNKRDFVDWIESNPSLSQISSNTRFPPRSVFGKYCEHRFNETIELCKQHDFEVKLYSKRSASKLIQHKKNQWRVSLENGESLIAEQVILALGHLPSDKYLELKNCDGYFHSPWQDIETIPGDQEVWILGAGLTAIDTVKLLVSNNHQGKIHLISPSGQLPTVKPPFTKETYKIRYLTPENISSPSLTLKIIIELCNQELAAATGKEDFDIEYYLSKKYSLKYWLQRQVDIVSKGVVRPWQFVLDHIYFDVLGHVWSKLSHDDRATILHKYYAPYMKWAAGTPLNNAKELLELVESGQLAIHGNLQSVTHQKDASSFVIKTASDKFESKALINATGDGHDISQNTLLSESVKEGMMTSTPCGAISIDSNSYRVISDEGKVHQGLYALGPTVFGSCPAVYAIDASVNASNAIADGVIANLIHRSEKHLSTSSHGSMFSKSTIGTDLGIPLAGNSLPMPHLAN